MKGKIVPISLTLVLLGTLALYGAPQVAAAPEQSFTVNSTDDDNDRNPGDGKCDASLLPGDKCTLRAAVMEANALSGTDTISIPAGTYTLTRRGYDDFASVGDLDIRASVNLIGASAVSTVIDGNGANTDDRVFDLRAGTIHLEHITIRGGHTQGTPIPGCCYEYGKGGGIAVRAGVTATLSDVKILDNIGLEAPGALSNDGSLSLDDVTFNRNCADEAHWAIRNDGTLTMTQSTTIGGDNLFCGGGEDGMLLLGNSTLVNSTINSVLAVPGVASLRNVTVKSALNNAGLPGFDYGTGTIGSFNSILQGCSGTLNSLGYNLIQSNSCTIQGNLAGNLLNIDPKLGALQSNGGLTSTRALLAGSPAIDAGNPAGCAGLNGQNLTTDQRGLPRPTDGNGDAIIRCDIGAFEVGPVGIGSVSPRKGASRPGEQQLFDVAWDSPTRWRDLQTVELRFKRGKEILLWLRFTEGLPNSTFSILDQDGNVVDSGNAGAAHVLKNKFGALDLSQSGFTASGPNDPHVVLHFAVTLKKRALGKLKMQMLAADDFANDQGPEPGSVWRVKE